MVILLGVTVKYWSNIPTHASAPSHNLRNSSFRSLTNQGPPPHVLPTHSMPAGTMTTFFFSIKVRWLGTFLISPMSQYAPTGLFSATSGSAQWFQILHDCGDAIKDKCQKKMKMRWWSPTSAPVWLIADYSLTISIFSYLRGRPSGSILSTLHAFNRQVTVRCRIVLDCFQMRSADTEKPRCTDTTITRNVHGAASVAPL